MLNFFREEKRVSVILFISIVTSLLHVFTNRIPEIFPFGYEIMILIFSISISVIAAIIFYIFQSYIPSIKIRKIANKKLQIACHRLIASIEDAFVSCSTEETIQKHKFQTLDDFLRRDIYLEICMYLDLEKEANISPKMNWADKLFLLGTEVREICKNVASQYSTCLTEKMLESLYHIESHPFIEVLVTINNTEFRKRKNSLNMSIIPINFMCEFFEFLKDINLSLGLNLKFFKDFVKDQKGLLGKARRPTPAVPHKCPMRSTSEPFIDKSQSSDSFIRFVSSA